MIALYIDDDLEDTEIFQEAITSVDPDVVFYSATDGLEGFRILEQITVVPDFIFLDVNMPRMNGKEFLTQIKKQITFRSIPVIMYSTTSHAEEIRKYKNMGAFAFVRKPDSFGILQTVLQKIISGRAADQWEELPPERKN